MAKNDDMFKCRSQIDLIIAKFSSPKDKRDEISKYSGPLWYVFGMNLVYKPWLTYEERFCNDITVSYHKKGQITEMVIKNDIL